jgi:hypothetical protein
MQSRPELLDPHDRVSPQAASPSWGAGQRPRGRPVGAGQALSLLKLCKLPAQLRPPFPPAAHARFLGSAAGSLLRLLFLCSACCFHICWLVAGGAADRTHLAFQARRAGRQVLESPPRPDLLLLSCRKGARTCRTHRLSVTYWMQPSTVRLLLQT